MNDASQLNQSYIGLRHDILKHIQGSGNRILDVGCSIGTNGKYLLHEGIAGYVCGFEFDPSQAKIAEDNISKVHCGDIETQDIRSLLEGETFDCMIFGDVLEHLGEPEKVLCDCLRFIKKGGKVIVSLPNIRHIDVFIHVYLKKTWPRNERGIFDWTHRRNFTFWDMKKMLDDCGLDLISYERNFRRRDAMDSRFSKFSIERVAKKIFKDLYTFQYILVCEMRS